MTVIEAGRPAPAEVDSSSHEPWTIQIPWHGLRTAATLAVVVSFVLMLTRERHRFGNRWAWFWIFAIAGGAGPLLYLVLEPAPLWRRGPGVRPFPPVPAFRGGIGFLLAIVLGIVGSVVLALLEDHLFGVMAR